jgi:N-acetylmuramoyl-L-alanine amidase
MNRLSIRNHKLPGVRYRAAFDVGQEHTIKGILLHYTAGSNINGSVETLTRQDGRIVSAHLVIGPDGTTIQLAPFNIKTAHAGESLWLDDEHLNNGYIGIEIENPGWLKEVGLNYETWFGRVVNENDVFIGASDIPEVSQTAWHKYPNAQVARVDELVYSLCLEYGILHTQIAGHDEVALPAGRKQDPGPAWNMSSHRETIRLALESHQVAEASPDETNAPYADMKDYGDTEHASELIKGVANVKDVESVAPVSRVAGVQPVERVE